MTTHKKCFFVFLSALLMAGVAESGARLLFSNLTWASRFLDYDETSNRIRWVLTNKFKDGRTGLSPEDVNQDAVHILTYHPIRGWMTKPHVEADQNMRSAGLTTGADGFRSGEIKPGESAYRILLLGDSFTFGDEVADTETYGHFLSELLPQASIINAGVSGYGHDQMLLLLQERGRELRPNLVIVGFTNVDIERNGKNFQYSAKPRAHFKGGRIIWDNLPVPSPLAVLAAEKWHLKLWDCAKIIYGRQHRLESEAANREISTHLLTALGREIADLGAKCLYCYIPHPSQPAAAQRLDSDGWVRDYCQAHREAFFSPVDEMMRDYQTGADIHPMPRGHFNPAGNQSLAKALAHYLLTSGTYPELSDAAAGHRDAAGADI